MNKYEHCRQPCIIHRTECLNIIGMDKYSPEERHQIILNLLESRDKVMAAELASQLSATEATIRRDLRLLAENGLCKRIHGGALSLARGEGSQIERLENNGAEKQALAIQALGILKQSDVVFIDAGSTHILLAGLLPQNMNLTVVTNSPDIASRVIARKNIRTILTGGEINPDVGAATDINAASAVKKFWFDVSFLGVCAWSSETGFSATSYQDMEFKRTVIANSGSVAVLCTLDKNETQAPFPFMTSETADYVVCSERNLAMKEYFAATGCHLRIAES